MAGQDNRGKRPYPFGSNRPFGFDPQHLQERPYSGGHHGYAGGQPTNFSSSSRPPPPPVKRREAVAAYNAMMQRQPASPPQQQQQRPFSSAAPSWASQTVGQQGGQASQQPVFLMQQQRGNHLDTVPHLTATAGPASAAFGRGSGRPSQLPGIDYSRPPLPPVDFAAPLRHQRASRPPPVSPMNQPTSEDLSQSVGALSLGGDRSSDSASSSSASGPSRSLRYPQLPSAGYIVHGYPGNSYRSSISEIQKALKAVFQNMEKNILQPWHDKLETVVTFREEGLTNFLNLTLMQVRNAAGTDDLFFASEAKTAEEFKYGHDGTFGWQLVALSSDTTFHFMVTYQAKSVKAGKDLYNRLEWRAEFSYPGRHWTQFNKLQSTDKDYRASAHGYSNHCMLAVGIYMLYHPSGTLFVTMAVLNFLQEEGVNWTDQYLTSYIEERRPNFELGHLMAWCAASRIPGQVREILDRIDGQDFAPMGPDTQQSFEDVKINRSIVPRDRFVMDRPDFSLDNLLKKVIKQQLGG